jgi:hypothetical protein
LYDVLRLSGMVDWDTIVVVPKRVVVPVVYIVRVVPGLVTVEVTFLEITVETIGPFIAPVADPDLVIDPLQEDDEPVEDVEPDPVLLPELIDVIPLTTEVTEDVMDIVVDGLDVVVPKSPECPGDEDVGDVAALDDVPLDDVPLDDVPLDGDIDELVTEEADVVCTRVLEEPPEPEDWLRDAVDIVG